MCKSEEGLLPHRGVECLNPCSNGICVKESSISAVCIFFILFFLIHLFVFQSYRHFPMEISQMPSFFDVKCRDCNPTPTLTSLITRQLYSRKISQMSKPLSPFHGSCEKPCLETPIPSLAKVLIFRKCRKFFPEKTHLRKNNR